MKNLECKMEEGGDIRCVQKKSKSNQTYIHTCSLHKYKYAICIGIEKSSSDSRCIRQVIFVKKHILLFHDISLLSVVIIDGLRFCFPRGNNNFLAVPPIPSPLRGKKSLCPLYLPLPVHSPYSDERVVYPHLCPMTDHAEYPKSQHTYV